MIQAYKDFWTHYADFEGRTNIPGFWFVVLVNLIIGCAINLISFASPNVAYIIDGIYSLAIIVPQIAIMVRRFRDGGKHWANIFWWFLPFIGWIIAIIKLCAPSVGEEA